MAKVEIYTTQTCGYCLMAKRLLNKKGVEFTEIDALDPATRETMMKRAEGRRTVPQIFINDTGIGGFDDLNALDRKGELDPMLAMGEA